MSDHPRFAEPSASASRDGLAQAPVSRRLRIKSALPVLMAAAILAVGPARSQEAAKPAPAESRVWTNLNGKKLTAGYLGVKGAEVVLQLPGGKVSFVPMATLSAEDNAFVRDHGVDYHAAWQAWPDDAGQSMQNVVVKEEAGEAGSFVYTTQHFRFHCDVNLGATLMKDLARTFELTFNLHSKSPFGILAKPEKDLYEAKLFGKLTDYTQAGGPGQTAGVYLSKEKVFLAPLELMGIRAGSGGYRKITDEYDVSTIVHELTHMLTHEMLDNLPVWANEGYAEYIANIPIAGKSFKTDSEKIREGVRDAFVRSHLRSISSSSEELPELSKSARADLLKSDDLPSLYKVEKVLQMTDAEWATGPQAPVPRGTDRSFVMPSTLVDPNRLPRLYRTAHLIFYYFIQIEGEKGVTKIRRFLEENRRHMDRYLKYEKDYQAFEAEFRVFMNLPGVTKLPDGRFQYPSNLTPPKEPVAPFDDPNALKLGGLPALLDGDSVAVVGARIEAALVRDLEANLRFDMVPRGLR